MSMDPTFLDEVAAALRGADAMNATLGLTLRRLDAESGTIHLLGDDGVLHLVANGPMPPPVLTTIERIPVGKGMAGLAVERGEPVTACNLQTDASGDVRPGAKLTGLEGSIVVPILYEGRALGALGVANRRERTFTPEETALLLDVGRAIAAASHDMRST